MALEPLAECFSELILDDQNCFGSQEGWEALLLLIPDRTAVDNLRAKWSNDPDRSSRQKWEDFKKQVRQYEKGTSQRVRNWLGTAIHS